MSLRYRLWNLAEEADYKGWWPRGFWRRLLGRLDRSYGYWSRQ